MIKVKIGESADKDAMEEKLSQTGNLESNSKIHVAWKHISHIVLHVKKFVENKMSCMCENRKIMLKNQKQEDKTV